MPANIDAKTEIIKLGTHPIKSAIIGIKLNFEGGPSCISIVESRIG